MRKARAGWVLAWCLGLGACQTPPPEAPKARVTGVLALRGAPAGAVLVIDESDELPLGPKQRVRLGVGAHRLSVECPGFFPAYYQVEISTAQEVALDLSLRPLVVE